jgi:DNA primase
LAFTDLNDQVIQQVRDAADLVDFVQQVTPLKLAGTRYKGLCPFHREKTPSFTVDRTKGLFYCFGCGTGGDIFKFLTLTERFTFPEAVEHVAARVGIELPKKKRTQKENAKDDLLELMDDASEAFHRALGWTPNPADAYLRERGVSKEIITRYGFGFAPDSWDYLLRLLGQKHGEKRLEAAGLITPRKEKAGYYDRFRNRLMIPIHSETGAIVGFGGRSLDGSDPKYLNSPESELFNKSRLLYNLHRSKDAMRRYDRAILVEGYFDAIAIDHAGVPGVVASMGTSLTTGQASLLRRYTRNIVLAYDGDNAGRAATLRAAPILLSAGLHVQALDLQGEKDPDSLIEKRGVDGFLEVLSNATDIFEFGLREWARDAAGLSGREKSERVEHFMPLLSAVTDPVVRNEAAQRIADAFRLEFESVWSRVRGKASANRADESRLRPSADEKMNGQKLVLIAALHGRLTPLQVSLLDEQQFVDPTYRTIYRAIQEDLAADRPVDASAIAPQLRGEAELTLLSELSLTEDLDERNLERLHEILVPMRADHLARRKQQLQRELVDALQSGDERRADELMAEKLALSKELEKLSAK